MRKLTVGIAGYGVVGRRRHDCVNQHPHMKLIAVCDQNFKDKNTIPNENGVHYYSNYKELLSEKLDVLFVCMTNEVAAEVTIAGLEKKLHVFCEKPPGRNLEDIKSVINCEKKHPELKLMYGFNHRYHESVKDAHSIINSGKFGKIINMRGMYGKSKLITFNQPDWRTRREIAGGGVLLDQGIHMVDLMRLFAGDFTEIHSFISNDHWKYDVEDNAYALMKTKCGIVSMLNSSATQWRHRFHLDINLDYGSIILGGILSGSKSYGSETLTIVTADPDNDYGDPKEQITKYNNDPSWNDEINYFADCIICNKLIESSSSEDAFNTMKHVYQIYYADENWRDSYQIPNPDNVRL
jgi:predicted dehydrogenase